MKNSTWVKIGIVGGIGLVAVLIAMDGVSVIEPGSRGIVVRFGKLQASFDSGLHFKIPVIDEVKTVDVRTRYLESSLEAASKDLQEIRAVVALNYRLDDTKLEELYSKVGLDFENRVVKPAIQEGVKAVTAKFTAEELITKRPEVKQQIVNDLSSRLASYYLVVDDLSIVNLSFSEAFNAAIEAKQTAVQNALRAENDLKRIEIEAKQKIETAKAEAESIKIQGQALKENAGLVQLKMVEKWDGKLPNAIIGGDGSNSIINLPAVR